MGRKARQQVKLFKRRLRSRTVTLPRAVKEALKDRGVEVPNNLNEKSLYRCLGIQSDPNADVKEIVGFRDRLGELKKQQRVAVQSEGEGDGEVFARAAQSIPHGHVYQKHLTEYELKCIAQLLAFYGDDLDMMAVDHRKNPMQWSVGQLRKLIKVYRTEAEALAAEADLLEGLGQ